MIHYDVRIFKNTRDAIKFSILVIVGTALMVFGMWVITEDYSWAYSIMGLSLIVIAGFIITSTHRYLRAS